MPIKNSTSARWRQFQGFALDCPHWLASLAFTMRPYRYIHASALSSSIAIIPSSDIIIPSSDIIIPSLWQWGSPGLIRSHWKLDLRKGEGRGTQKKGNTRKCNTGKYIWVAFLEGGGVVIKGGRNDFMIKSQVTYWSSSDPFVWREPGGRHKRRSRTEDDPWRIGHLLLLAVSR